MGRDGHSTGTSGWEEMAIVQVHCEDGVGHSTGH